MLIVVGLNLRPCQVMPKEASVCLNPVTLNSDSLNRNKMEFVGCDQYDSVRSL